MPISRNIRMQVRAESGEADEVQRVYLQENNHRQHRRSLVAINKAPNTHNEILLGAEENTSGANVTRRIHQQRSWKTNVAQSQRNHGSKTPKERRGVRDIGLSSSAKFVLRVYKGGSKKKKKT